MTESSYTGFTEDEQATEPVEIVLPTEPGAYWRPEKSLSDVWSLRFDGSWHHNISMGEVEASAVPRDLQLLGLFAEPITLKAMDSSEISTVPISGVQGSMRAIAPCSALSSETQIQAGLIPTDSQGPSLLFFGVQTDPDSFGLVEELKLLQLDSSAQNEVELNGYFKQVRSSEGESYLDTRVLFVEELFLIR